MLKLVVFVPPIRRSFSFSHVTQSGHNKWSKIKQRKGAKDAQRSVVFGKAAKDIVVAARTGGGIDPAKNLQLAAVLKRARETDVPKENIEKALAKAGRAKDHGGETFIYEVLALNSVGLIVECATDNSNRTIHSLREIINNYSARAAPVKFMFQRVGYIKLNQIAPIENGAAQTDELIELALSNGAVDFGNVTGSDGSVSVWFTCELDQLYPLTSSLSERFQATWEVGIKEPRYLARDQSEKVSNEAETELKCLVEDLEANEDVLQVWSSIQEEAQT